MAVRKYNTKYRLDIITERFLFEIIKVLSSDTLVSRRMLTNINKLFDDIDLDYYYQKNNELAVLIKTIKIISNIKKYNHIFDTDGAIVELQTNLNTEVYEKFLNNSIIPIIESSARKEFTHKCEELNKAISIYLQYGFVLNLKGELMSKINDIESSYGAELVDSIMSLRNLINQLNEYFRNTDSNNIMGGLVHLIEDDYVDSLMETHKQLRDPGLVLRTGLQAMNRCLSVRGGFVPGLYFFYANTNNWKSALVEQIGIQIQKFNNHIFKLKEFMKSNKIPTFLRISLENSQNDDNEREFKMRTHMDLDSFNSAEMAVKKWKAMFYTDGDSANPTINIAEYRPSEIDGIRAKFRVSDLIDLIDTLNEEGYRVIGASIDQLEMIAPEKEDEGKEIRIRYGIIAAMLAKVYIRYNIPIIVPHQLNRESERVIDDMKREGKMNIVTLLGPQYISESYAVERSATFSAFILLEDHPITKKHYFGFKRHKSRGKKDLEWPYFYHEIINGLCLQYDIDLPQPLSLKSLILDADPAVAQAYNTVQTSVGSRGRISPIQPNDPIVLSEESKVIDNVIKQTMIFDKPKYKEYVWVSKRDRKERQFIREGKYVWIK